MEAVQVIKKLKNYSFSHNENEERDLVEVNKFRKDGYSYAYIINKTPNKYEVYMVVLSDVDKNLVASNLLYKEFKYLDQAKEYFNELIDKYNDLSVEELYNIFNA